MLTDDLGKISQEHVIHYIERHAQPATLHAAFAGCAGRLRSSMPDRIHARSGRCSNSSSAKPVTRIAIGYAAGRNGIGSRSG